MAQLSCEQIPLLSKIISEARGRWRSQSTPCKLKIWKFNQPYAFKFFGHGGSPQGQHILSVKRVDHLPTCNVLFYRPSLLASGNFSLKMSSTCEDVEMGLRLRQRGHSLLLLNEPQVTNSSYLSWRDWMCRMFRFGYHQSRIKLGLRPFPHWPSLLSALLCGIFALATLAKWTPWATLPLFTYFFTTILISLNLVWKARRWDLFYSVICSFLCTHLSYGLGSLFGYLSLGLERLGFNFRKTSTDRLLPFESIPSEPHSPHAIVKLDLEKDEPPSMQDRPPTLHL